MNAVEIVTVSTAFHLRLAPAICLPRASTSKGGRRLFARRRCLSTYQPSVPEARATPSRHRRTCWMGPSDNGGGIEGHCQYTIKVSRPWCENKASEGYDRRSQEVSVLPTMT